MNEIDGWIEWKGGDRPHLLTDTIDVMFRDGRIRKNVSGEVFRWRHDRDPTDIMSYRLLHSSPEWKDIPADIRDEADRLTCVSGLSNRARAVALALLAERERCAAACVEYREAFAHMPSGVAKQSGDNASQIIENAVRHRVPIKGMTGEPA